MINQTLLDILALNREGLMKSNSTALGILSIIRKNYHDLYDEECILSLSLNESIARMIYHADYDRSIAISRAILERFPDTEYAYYVCRHLAVIGRCQALSGSAVEAAHTLARAYDMIESGMIRSDDILRLSADILHDRAMNNMMSGGTPDIAVQYLEQALTIIEHTDYQMCKGVSLMGLGNIRYSEGKVHDALDYYLKAEQIFDEESNFSNWASISSNIGLCHMNLGYFQMAEKYLTRSLSLRRKIGNSDEISISFFNLSLLYEMKGNLDKAILNMIACRSNASRSVNKKIYDDSVLYLKSLIEKNGGKYDSLFVREQEVYAHAL